MCLSLLGQVQTSRNMRFVQVMSLNKGDRSFRTDFSPVETHIAFLLELAFLVSFNAIDLRRPILEKKPSS